jgi:hypothetical protein
MFGGIFRGKPGPDAPENALEAFRFESVAFPDIFRARDPSGRA